MAALFLVTVWALACSSSGAPSGQGCVEQATAVYDTVPLVRRADGTVWVAADRARFTEVLGASGPLRANDIAASGSTAYGSAIGCAIVDDASVWCFPLAGPLIDSTDLGAGLGAGVTTSDAVQVVTAQGAPGPPLAGARQLSASMNGGGATFCALTDAGGVACWGYGVAGILGRGDAADSAVARPVLADASVPFTDAVEIRLGFDSACARKSDGSVWCWGDDTLGQLGQLDIVSMDATQSPFPVAVALPGPAARLAANPGKTHCALLRDGRVACWGWNAYAQAGADAAHASVAPTIVLTAASGPPLTGVVDLAPDHGMQAMCATTMNGALVCWGHPFAGPSQANQPDATSPYPIAIPTDGPVRLPLSSYGGRDGALVYVDASGRLTLEAGAFPFAAQPPCE